MYFYKFVFALFLLIFFYTKDLSAINTDWWKHSVIYQIYPRSFKDSNNDGIGDINGIIENFDHLIDMNITAFWLSPVYKSPQVDQGYDISDYRQIDQIFGTMDDFDKLLSISHKAGIKVIMDFVPNHTSNEHEWFLKSLKRDPYYDDFYIWQDCQYDAEKNITIPPNNWISVFKGSAWSWSPERQQCYLHQFSIAQPDLNYFNPNVVKEIKETMEFWLDKGVDGFRIDAVPYIIEDNKFRNEPKSNCANCSKNDPEYLDHIYTKDLPKTYDIIQEWRELIDNYTIANGVTQRIIMTEAYSDLNSTIKYYGSNDGKILRAYFTFNFLLLEHISINSTVEDIKKTINMWQNALSNYYTSNWVLGNHDNGRIATRLGVENVDGFNMLLFILPGITVTYNGEEIGMENGYVPYEDGQDPSARDPKTFYKISRDFERTPFQWDSSVNAGFNKGAKPWLPVSEKYLETNLENEKKDQNSHYNIYKKLVQIKQLDILKNGSTEVDSNQQTLIVTRKMDNEKIILLFNISSVKNKIDLSNLVYNNTEIVIKCKSSTHKEGTLESLEIVLAANESIILYTTK